MENVSEKNLLITLIALVAVFGIFLSSKMNTVTQLANQINSLQSTVQSQNQQISGLYGQIESLLQKQASLVDHYNVTYGEVDGEKLTYEIQVSVTPKEFKDSSTAELTLGDLTFGMVRNGSTFTCAATVPISKEVQPTVSFHEDGLSRTETLDTTVSFKNNYLCKVKANYGGSKSYSGKQVNYDGSIILYIDSNDSTSGRILVLLDGKQAYTKDLKIENGKESTLSFNEIFSVEEGERLTLYAEIKDAGGLTYRYILDDMTVSSKGGPQPETSVLPYDNVLIFDKKGNEIKFE